MNQPDEQPKIETREPALTVLQGQRALNEKLAGIHAELREQAPGISRIGIALFDEQSGVLKTFVHSSDDATPLKHYESSLEGAPALEEMIRSRKARIVHDLTVFDAGSHEHTRKISAGGFQSSYTFPMILADEVTGFIFFNASETGYFSAHVVQLVDVFAHLITHVVMNDIKAVRTLLGAMREANDMVHYRDPETGLHLERMSRFSRLIARHLARTGKHDFDDEYIEDLFLFAPMHDVGKIGIPDEILLKPGRLTKAEFSIMQTHTLKGREIIDAIVRNFGLDTLQNMDMLKNIAEFHHETIDGSGYPQGLHGKQIPIEARIIAVADIFDALTSERPYKEAWSNARALEFLRAIAGHKLDSDCVDALEACLAQITEIQQRFAEQEDASGQ